MKLKLYMKGKFSDRVLGFFSNILRGNTVKISIESSINKGTNTKEIEQPSLFISL